MKTLVSFGRQLRLTGAAWLLSPLLILALCSAAHAQFAYNIIGGQAQLASYSGSGAVTIPATYDGYPVTSIGIGAFAGSTPTSVSIPYSVTDIGEQAFQGCGTIGTITYSGSGLQTVEDFAFDGCSGLTSGSLPVSVTSVGRYAFQNCTSLSKVPLSSNTKLTGIGDYAYNGCTGLTSVALPSTLPAIGNYVFNGCAALTNITIPAGVTSIGDGAFAATGLTSVSIPNGVTTLGNATFSGCTALTAVTFPTGLTSFGDNTFFSCTALTSITIPAGVTFMGNTDFEGCSNLVTALFLTGTAPTIGTSAFAYTGTGFTVYYNSGAVGFTTPIWTDSSGDGYSAYVLGPAPVVATLPVSSFTYNTATLPGTVNPGGMGTSYYFRYGLTGTYGQTTGTQSATGSLVVSVSANLTGLVGGATYHYQLVAINISGTSSSGDATFVTADPPPTVTTGTAAGVTYNQATLTGTINPNGLDTTYYYQYGTSLAYGTSTAIQDAGIGSSPVLVSATVAGLVYSTTYDFRLVAVNSSGTTYGLNQTVKTSALPSPPIETTGIATGTTYNSVVLSGTINPNGGTTICWFQYGLSAGYGFSTGTFAEGNGTVGVFVSATLSGLTANTTYYYRLTGSNLGGTSFGTGSNFKTLTTPLAPTVTTGSATAITYNGLTVTGTVGSTNGASATYFVQSGTSVSYGTTSGSQTAASGTTSVTVPLTGLNPGTVYHYRLVAFNVTGTTNGADKTGTTNAIPPPPVVVTGSATGMTATTGTINGTINPNGAPTAYWFRSGTSLAYGTTTGTMAAGSGTSVTPVSATLTGLIGATTYYYQLVAANIGGTNYGVSGSFTTANYPPPTVTTGTATVPTYQTATVTGTVIPNYLPTTVYFLSGTSATYAAATGTTTGTAIGSGTSPVPCTANISGFPVGVVSYYWIVGVNASGTSYGLSGTFSRPVGSDADLSALKLSAGALNPAFTASGTGYTLNVANSVASTTVTATSATNSIRSLDLFLNGFNRGALKSGKPSIVLQLNAGGFSTSIGIAVTAEDGATVENYAVSVYRVALPVTGSATGLTFDTGILNASVDGNATSVVFDYGLTKTYGSTTKSVGIVGGSGTQQVSASLTGLTPATLYHYRVAVTTGSLTDYGADLSFTTPPVWPGGAGPTGIPLQNIKFVSYGNPAINNHGNVAFEAVVTGAAIKVPNYSAIFTGSSTIFTGTSEAVNEIAETGVSPAAPDASGSTGTIGSFATLGDPVFNNNGAVAFFGTLKGPGTPTVTVANNRGIWANSSGTLRLVARGGQTVITTGSLDGTKFASFSQLALPDIGGPVFLANLAIAPGKVTAKNNQGIWTTSTNGTLQLMVGTGQPLAGGTIASLSIFAAPAGVSGQTRSFDSAGDLIFNATLTSGTQGVYIRMADGSISPVANKGEGTPPTSGTASTGQSFSALSSPIVNNRSHAAFYATISGGGVTVANNSGIWAETTGTGNTVILGEVVRTGDPAPNVSGSVGALASGTFSALGSPVSNDSDDVAFIGTLKISGTVTTLNNHGIWLWTGSTGTLAQLARTQQLAADCGSAEFASFSELALPNTGGAVVLANLVGKGITVANNQGLWVIGASGQSTLIARKGEMLVIDPLHVKTISALSMFGASTGVGGQTRCFNDFGDVIYKVTFTDGTQSIYEVTSP